MWDSIRRRSASVSGPGFVSTLSGMPIFPMSWRMKPYSSPGWSSIDESTASVSAVAYRRTRSECAPVPVCFVSSARASATTVSR